MRASMASMLTNPVLLQRLEGAAAAALAVSLFVHLDAAWWWLLVWFLAFDVSASGFLAGPRIGAALYNAVHSYAVPLALATVAVVTDSRALGLVALAWVFHIGVDRALGYGLKLATGFQDTHMGRIGRATPKA